MSEEDPTTMGSPTASTTDDASVTGPASTTVASRGDDGGGAVTSGGSSSAPASQSSASAAPKQGVDAADGDDHMNVPGTSVASTPAGSISCVATTSPRGPQILSTAEVDGLFVPGQPMPREATSDVPFDWVDPNPAPEGQQFLVGVPALAEDFRVGNHIANTYGGPCVLVSLESFTAEDIWELERVIPGFIERQMLVSRVESRDRQNLEAHMGSIDVNRELASILMHLPHQRLAERVYKTTGYLKQMAGAHRRLRLQVESQGNTSLVGTATAQNESEDLKRQWVFNCQY
ncbi:hypothetical protein P3T76_007464 [Phytophthora citrophthora]|uniref:Uncharacterized protein n=1 Tax=Phytophthora citrophthora TaxID=4793 RepID=A0AAD9GMA7_9STRA|nr:hypothetical protein P3T76_007464 [Phytophthora citrophthora]